MAIFMLPYAIYKKTLALWKFQIGNTFNIYEVLVSENRNYLGSERHLLELYFRAKDIDEARDMLEQFKLKFHYPKYFEPVEMGVMRFLLISVFPRNHNVLWREKVCNEEYHFCSLDIAELNK